MYLATEDDYPEDPANGPGHEYSDVDPAQYRPKAAHSEIVFGGVHHAHYQGCLKWHDVVDLSEYEDAGCFWALSLQGIRVQDEDLPFGEFAIIDSGSTFVLGPAKGIGKYLELNGVECFDLDDFGDAIKVECNEEFGFDVAATTCENDLIPLSFFVGGEQYDITKDELLMKVETDSGEICFLRIMSDFEISSGWVLGDVFMDRYFAAFDFENNRIGLAVAAANASGSYCEEDWPLDIEYEEGIPVPESVPTTSSPTPIPTASKVAPTTVPPPKMGGDVAPSTPSVLGAAAAAAASPGGRQSFGIAIVFAFGVLIMVFAITSRRRRLRYRRADRYDDGTYSAQDGSGDVELPGLL